MAGTTSLKLLLETRTMQSADELVRNLGDDAVQCLACGHRCRVLPGRAGVCRVRFNSAGRLMAPSGYVAGVAVDPIEKKPFFHAYPGANALSFGMLGCDLHCGYCQNWITSQALRDDAAVSPPLSVSPEELVQTAVRRSVPVIVSTYNEPLITADWAAQIFRLARGQGIHCGFVSNGNGTPEVLAYLRPFTDLFKVDLKSMRDRNYRELGGQLDNVLDTIARLVQLDYWVEVVTLIVPGFNDSDDELREAATFLAGISPNIPWHVTAYRPEYRMTDPPPTTASTLLRACRIGYEAGLRYVYAGNRPGRVGDLESTKCHACGTCLIERKGFAVVANRLRDGACPSCGTVVPGRW